MMNGDATAKATGTAALAEGREQDATMMPAAREPPPLFSDSDDGSSGSSGSGSEPVASPVITSPPYWMTRRHNRAPSTISVEDLPGAITLQDNENDDGSGGGNIYGRDRNRACWARSVEVRDHVLVNSSPTNIGAFVVWNIRVETLNVRFLSRSFVACQTQLRGCVAPPRCNAEASSRC